MPAANHFRTRTASSGLQFANNFGYQVMQEHSTRAGASSPGAAGRKIMNAAALRTTPPGKYVILYDGRCPFCTRQSRRLARLARPELVETASFQEPGVLDRFPGLTHQACMKAMHLVTPDGRIFLPATQILPPPP